MMTKHSRPASNVSKSVRSAAARTQNHLTKVKRRPLHLRLRSGCVQQCEVSLSPHRNRRHRNYFANLSEPLNSSATSVRTYDLQHMSASRCYGSITWGRLPRCDEPRANHASRTCPITEPPPWRSND